jgi:hypothetical protein
VIPGRPDRRLHLILVLIAERILLAFPPAVARQPGQIQRPQVPGCEFGADADDGGQRVLGIFHPLPRLVLARQVEDHVVARDR